MMVADSDLCGKMGRTQYMRINSILVTTTNLVDRELTFWGVILENESQSHA